MPLMVTSATQIRQLMASNAGKTLAINTLVTEPVARYISANHLYSRP
jgi:nicotinic acid mononucleotide adenylyltransferase